QNKTDATGAYVPHATAALQGSRIVPTFSVTRPRGVPFIIPVGGRNPEVFYSDGRNILQLTNFGRPDLGSWSAGPAVASERGHRVFFAASADPFGDNEYNN